MATGHPQGGLLVLGASEREGSGLLWLREVENARSALSRFVPDNQFTVMRLASDSKTVVVFDQASEAIEVLQPGGERRFVFSARAFFALHGIGVAGDRVFGLGSPLLSSEPITRSQLLDAEWRQDHRREDCRLFMTDLLRDHLRVDPLFCKSSLAPVASPLWGGGLLLVGRSEDRIYAVLKSHPALLVFDQKGKLLAESSYLRDGESWQPPDGLVPMGSSRQDWRMALSSLEERDYPSGLVEGLGTVAVVFRRERAKKVTFEADIFDKDGRLLVPGKPLDLRTLSNDVLLRTVRLIDGRQYLLLQSLQGFSEIESQRLFRVELVEGIDRHVGS